MYIETFKLTLMFLSVTS